MSFLLFGFVFFGLGNFIMRFRWVIVMVVNFCVLVDDELELVLGVLKWMFYICNKGI